MSSPMETAEIRRIIEAAAAAADPGSWTPGQAIDELTDWAAIERLAAAQRMRAARRVEVTDGWKDAGSRSAPDYVAKVTGLPVGRAGAELSTARKLEELPATAQAVREGRLSPAQAMLVADAATLDPSAEGQLLEHAGSGTYKGLADAAKRVQMAATDDAAREKRIRRNRVAQFSIDAEGAFTGRIYGPASVGVQMMAKYRMYEEQQFRDAKHTPEPDGSRSTYEQRSFDAFAAMVLDDTCPTCATDGVDDTEEIGAGVDVGPSDGRRERDRQDEEELAGGAPTPGQLPEARSTKAPPPSSARRPAKRAKKRKQPSSTPRTKVIILCPLNALVNGEAGPGETVEIAGVGPVSVATVREIIASGNPFLTAVVTDGVDVYNVAHLGREATAHQRTALEALGARLCANVECNATAGIEIDHREDWIKTFRTHVRGLDPLCSVCHKRKTHHGWQLEPGNGRRRFLPPSADAAFFADTG